MPFLHNKFIDPACVQELGGKTQQTRTEKKGNFGGRMFVLSCETSCFGGKDLFLHMDLITR